MQINKFLYIILKACQNCLWKTVYEDTIFVSGCTNELTLILFIYINYFS